ncbi:MAG: hypothetical protein HOH82_10135 [Planctomycetaceae bacterium]|nr:hypothetical protein [Planctomycetaceae bacterium]
MRYYSFTRTSILLLTGLICMSAGLSQAADPWVEYKGTEGPGKGKHIVLISGDEEYRSEEALPMLGQILAIRHGFKCTVLFSINPKDGTIDPTNQTNIPGIEKLAGADLMILALRFRELPDSDMKHFDQYVNSGKPIIGLRTATHSFSYSRNKQSPFARYSFNNGDWKGGFGQQVLGDTWISHHGHHGRESTRGVINPKNAKHPILTGVDDIWGPTDVYGIRNLLPTDNILVRGQVLTGMKPSDKPVAGQKNQPMMPLVWTREYTGTSGKTSRIVCTTMGASVDFESAGLRRAIVNASYWCTGMEKQISPTSSVDYIREYKPTFFGFGKYTRGVKPSDHAL